MREPALDDARRVSRRALDLYADDPLVVEALTSYDQRLQGPLRVALAGIVKAGKSTLLNALLGESIAATDAGECTRVVTWYRRAETPTITLHPHVGPPRRLPFRREDGRVVLSLDGMSADDVAWIDVGWPSESLRSLVVIDTPGIASLSAEVSERSTSFLTKNTTASAADAVIYLMRHLHESDRKFLEAFRDTAVGESLTVNAVAVLSRTDEIGSARIDSLLSAAQVAERYGRDGDLHSLVLDVLPVAGLLAEAARTLREKEFRALVQISDMERRKRERLLMSADRFVRPNDSTTLSPSERKELLSRFGLFGVRLSSALIRGGARTSTELADQLVQQSGLNALQTFIRTQFRARAATLKVHGVLPGLESIIRENPREGSAELLVEIERIIVTTHSLRELSALSRTRAGGYRLPEADLAEAERIVGGRGAEVADRLGITGVPSDSSPADIDALLVKWHGIAESPLTERAAVELCRTVIRSLEQIASVERARSVGSQANHIALPR
ncbi:dynamin family protein [Microbacterium sp. NPDC076911]|uniref:dynamin family protein n=1 Tax=Microbacterium sp. NPDC076911 TaxID=3154958 RepID=UPI00341703A2